MLSFFVLDSALTPIRCSAETLVYAQILYLGSALMPQETHLPEGVVIGSPVQKRSLGEKWRRRCR